MAQQQQMITFETKLEGFGGFAIDQYGIDLTDQFYVVSHFTIGHLLALSQGILSARLSVTLPGNAVLDRLQVKVTARRADQADAGTVAQLRAVSGDQTDQHVITVDFGTVRTVAAVRFNVASFIEYVDAWSGTDFPVSRYGSLTGRVERISATSFEDEEGNRHYVGRIALDQDHLAFSGARHPIQPGMTATVSITTGNQTILDYLLRPVFDSLRRAFSER